MKSLKAPFNIPQFIAGVFSPVIIAALCSFISLVYGPYSGAKIAQIPSEYLLFWGFIGFVLSLNIPLMMHFPTVFSFPDRLKNKFSHFLFGYNISCGLGLSLVLLTLSLASL